MSTEVRLPQIADSDTKAKLSVWLKHEGDRVTAGAPLVEVETDKTTVEIEAPVSGLLVKVHIPEGADGLAAGALLAIIADDDVVAPVVERPGRPTERRNAEPIPARPARAPAPQARAIDSPAEKIDFPAPVVNRDANATPLAAEMARLAGLDLASLGGAAKGRITKLDVEGALGRHRDSTGSQERVRQERVKPVTGSVEPIAPPERAGGFRDQPFSGLRRVTASRMLLAKQTIPHFYLEAECGADAFMRLRAQLNAKSPDVNITVTDLLVFIAARALKKVPLANSAWMETALRVYDSVDIAVAVNTPKGLITPIVRSCQSKTLGSISADLKELTKRARSGQLNAEEYTGGTFTLSNLGMFAVTSITPIINPPHACILGVGAIEKRPVVVQDEIVVGQTMHCTVAADHRAIDGVTAAELLAEIRSLIEDPTAAMLDL